LAIQDLPTPDTDGNGKSVSVNVPGNLGFRPITRISPGYETAQLAKRANLRVINHPFRFIAPVSDCHPITAIQALEFPRIDDKFPGFKKIVLA
jgi:hypothetical protein